MDIYYLICFFILGAILASFYDVWATRLPINKSIITPRSHCESCNKPLEWYELIPIISYILQRGKCRHCHQKIGIETFLVEIVLGILFSLSYYLYGFSYEYLMLLIIESLMILIFISDIKYFIILDSPLVISSILIIILKLFFKGTNNVFTSIISGIILFAFMFLVGKLGNYLFKRESLGGGDIKLSFVIGLILPPSLAISALVLSTFLALPYATYSLVTKVSKEVPFGPFLVSALWLVFIFQDKFLTLLEALSI